MDFYDIFFYLSMLGGFLMAFSLGANDAANAMASAVGARAVTVRQAVFIASIMNFIGASFLGGQVVATISKGIVDTQAINDPMLVTLGMFATLLTAGFFVLVSTITGYPVSSTHAVIGGLMGFGCASGGFQVVYWGKLVEIVLSWIISPVLGGVTAFAMYRLLRWAMLDREDQRANARRWCPVWMGFTAGIVTLDLVIDIPALGYLEKDWFLLTLAGVFMTLYVWEMGKNLIREFLEQLKESDAVQAIFRRLQVFTSAYVALSQGSNDVANAFGPVVAIYAIAKTHRLPEGDGSVPSFLLVMGGIGIAVGISVLGEESHQDRGPGHHQAG